MSVIPGTGEEPKLRLQLRTGRISVALVIGGTAAVTAVGLELVQTGARDPQAMVKLLESWGPWFIIAIFAIWSLRDLLMRCVDYFGQLVNNIGEMSKNMGALSSGVQQIAAKDDRNMEHMTTLVTHAARMSEKTFTKMDEMHKELFERRKKEDES